MENSILINGRQVGPQSEVFVIAEIGINHNGDLDTAKKLIDQAKWAGASAVKLQTYITEKRVPKDSPIYGILKQCEISFEGQKELFRYSREKGIEIFSTPFDEDSVDFLSSLGMSCFKIASFDIVNTRLLRKVAQQKKPVIISRGMASQKEIDIAVSILREHGAPLALLHCVSAYPVKELKALNFRTIAALAERYGCPVGYSDHTLGIEAVPYAVAAGACIIEKHFTLSRQSPGPDHALSTEPSEMKAMIEKIRQVTVMLGKAAWSSVEEEKDILQYRRVS